MARYIPKEEALEHPFRRPMMERVEGDPGISLSELADAFDVTPSTVLWHARKLSGAGILRMERRGRRRLFFPSAGGEAVRQQALARDALRGEQAPKALDAIQAQPGVTAPRMAERLDIGLHAARDLLARLASAGLVEPVRTGRAIRYYAAAQSHQLATSARQEAIAA